MLVEISKSAPQGSVTAPPSKSIAHRRLICASLSDGVSHIRNIEKSDDIKATVDCLRAMGMKIFRRGNDSRVAGFGPVPGAGSVGTLELDCRESGSTLRFMMPRCLLSGRPALLRGRKRLMERPLSVYEDIFTEQGIRIRRDEGSVYLEGSLRPGTFTVPGDISSQFVSGLLFALPLLEGNSVIRLLPPVESRPYIDMTVKCLSDCGIAVRWEDGNTISVPGSSVFKPFDSEIEGDFSNAAFFEAMNLAGGKVRVCGLPDPDESTQADRVYGKLFERLRKGFCAIDVSDCPDLAPVLFAAAALCHGGRFTGTKRLSYKESDRSRSMAEELAKFGIKTDIGENEVTVEGSSTKGLRAPSATLSSHNDHRIAMALSVLCAATGGCIDGAEAVQKSFPDYWSRLKGLKVRIR